MLCQKCTILWVTSNTVNHYTVGYLNYTFSFLIDNYNIHLRNFNNHLVAKLKFNNKVQMIWCTYLLVDRDAVYLWVVCPPGLSCALIDHLECDRSQWVNPTFSRPTALYTHWAYDWARNVLMTSVATQAKYSNHRITANWPPVFA